MADQSGGGHLAAGHTIDGIVDEEGAELLAALSSVNDLVGADGGQVTIALIGKHRGVGMHALDAGGNSGGTTVRRLHHINIHVLVSHNGAAHGGNGDAVTQVTALLQHFHNQAMSNTVRAAGAVVQLGLTHTFCIFKYGLQLTSPP